MRAIIYSFLFLVVFLSSAQSSQGEYLEAKRQYALGNYSEARLSFQSLTADPVFGAYASFYYALSSLKLEEPKVAEDMLRQVQVKYQDWDQQEEVTYWLTYAAFQQKKFWRAFNEAEKLSKAIREPLIDGFLGKMSITALDSAYALNPDNKYIGTYYAKSIKEQPLAQQDKILLREISEKFDLSFGLSESLPLVIKDEYAVALVLPFMYDSLGTPQTVIRNSIIFDLYQGMTLAQEELMEQGIKLNLFPFDTKKRGSVAYDLIKDEKLDKADLIIGPLYSGPSRYISEFSKENGIPMINPVSSNETITTDNPYSFLFKSSYSTQGIKAAEYAAEKFNDNKKVFIFYETDRDSIVAHAYKDRIEKDSFFVIRFDRLTNEDAQQIQKDFTEEYEVRLDTMYNQNELDSLAEIPGRTIRTRSLRNERTGRIMRDENGDEVIETYEVNFYVQPDSIGHIFAATSSNLLANNLISMVEVRSDSIGIIGYNDWLDFSLVSYDQLERLQIDFLSPSYYDISSVDFERIESQFIEQIGTAPSEYHVYGYEMIWQLGTLMNEHGKYFQRGWAGGNLKPGLIMEGLKYGIYQDNQVVPITTLKNLELTNQNSPKEVIELDDNRNE